MTEDVADAIVDWVDADDDARASGAESSYYLSLAQRVQGEERPAQLARRAAAGPGVTPELLYGDDRNRNGVADDDDGGAFDRGWADYLTVYGRELNVDIDRGAADVPQRVEDLPGCTSSSQQAVGPGTGRLTSSRPRCSRVSQRHDSDEPRPVTSGGAVRRPAGDRAPQQWTVPAADGSTAAVQAAMPAPGQQAGGSSSLLDLRTRRSPSRRPGRRRRPTPRRWWSPSPAERPGQAGPNCSPLLMDKTTTTTNVEMIPRINVNTAPREVLLADPGHDRGGRRRDHRPAGRPRPDATRRP